MQEKKTSDEKKIKRNFSTLVRSWLWVPISNLFYIWEAKKNIRNILFKKEIRKYMRKIIANDRPSSEKLWENFMCGFVCWNFTYQKQFHEKFSHQFNHRYALRLNSVNSFVFFFVIIQNKRGRSHIDIWLIVTNQP